jgi:hypothetical protein
MRNETSMVIARRRSSRSGEERAKVRFRRRRSTLAVVLALMSVLGSLLLAGRANASSGAPTSTNLGFHDITTGANFPPPGGVGIASTDTFKINGTSYEDVSVGSEPAKAILSLQNADTLMWLQTLGGFATGVVTFTVTISASNCTQQSLNGVNTWVCTWGWTPPGEPYLLGAYIIRGHTVDAAGNAETAQETHFSYGASAGSGDAAYFTLSFGRAVWAQFDDNTCTTPIGGANGSAYTLAQVAALLPSLNTHLFGVGNVVTNRTFPSVQECADSDSYPMWSQLTSLASSYGWKFTTAGEVYRPLAGLSLTDPITDEAVVQNPAIANASNMQSETCGAKNYMDNKGFPEANGMFDYPNDSVTLDDSDTLQTNYVLGCYYWGRRYSADPQTYGVQVPSGPNGMPVNDNGSGTTPLWYSRVVSVSGGACYSLGTDLPGFPNGTGLTCPGSPPPGNPMPNVTTGTQECEACSAAILNEPDSGNGLPLYPNVDGLVTLAQTLTAGHWLDFQFYRLVTGSNLTGTGPTWDCTSSNWRQHWTSDGELFCYTDFTRIMKALPSSATITDPQTVGVAWRSSPPAADTTPAP